MQCPDVDVRGGGADDSAKRLRLPSDEAAVTVASVEEVADESVMALVTAIAFVERSE